MEPCSIRDLVKLIAKRVLRVPFNGFPEGAAKFGMRSAMARYLRGIPSEFLVGAGDTVVLVGVHRIDTVMLWSCLVGPRGRVVVIEAVPDYVENIRRNLEHHLNWPLENITYVAKGVDSTRGSKTIQIGERADYNKLANQAIVDGLSDSDYVREVQIEVDTIDQILADNNIEKVDYVYITISGMELEALKGMDKTLRTDGLRVQIRSLHMKDGEPIYVQVVKALNDAGLKTTLGRKLPKFKGRDIFASRV